MKAEEARGGDGQRLGVGSKAFLISFYHHKYL